MVLNSAESPSTCDGAFEIASPPPLRHVCVLLPSSSSFSLSAGRFAAFPDFGPTRGPTTQARASSPPLQTSPSSRLAPRRHAPCIDAHDDDDAQSTDAVRVQPILTVSRRSF